MRDIYRIPLEKLFAALKTNRNGLTKPEIQERESKYGPNTITPLKEKSPLMLFIDQFRSFLVWLLVIADIGSVILWIRFTKQEYFFNLVVITFIILANASLGFFQEFQARKHADKLKALLKNKAHVLRNGQTEEIIADDLVIGDIIILNEGDKIPSDARLIEAKDFQTDESSLTGESAPVEKQVIDIEDEKTLADRVNMIFSQTFVVKGEAKAVVTSIGMQTEVGKIFASINKTKTEKTSFEKEIDAAGKRIAFVIGTVIVIIAVILTYHKMPFSYVFIISISLAVGAIPEGLPAITTFVLALGSQRMLKNNFLVKKLSSIESLGSIDVIATDKTGTLTQNKMSAERIFLNDHDIDLTEDKHLSAVLSHEVSDTFLHTIVLANEIQINKNGAFSGDPTEISLLDLAKINGIDPKRVKGERKKLDLLPFSSDSRFSASLYGFPTNNKLFVTGAPEVVLAKCSELILDNKSVKLSEEERKKILAKTEDFSKNALRIIAIAHKETKDSKIKNTDDMAFIALVGLKDPPRPEVKDAIAHAKSAGIKVIMLTGDYKLTAQAIAHEIGLGEQVTDATELKDITDDNLKIMVEKTDIFSRMDPSFKLRILSMLQKNGHRVAMTGDGVNDAPALKKADISLAMGIRGTELAKEVSHVILLDDNFATIVKGIKEGRTIFHNLRKFVNYILTANVAEVMIIFITSLFGFVPLTATQILWTNFVTDVFPAMALGVDPAPSQIMKQKPMGAKEHVLNSRIIGLTLAIGIKKTIIMLGLFVVCLRIWDINVARTAVFTWLVLSHFIRILSIRVNEKVNFFINKYVNISIFASSLLQMAILYSPIKLFFNSVSLTAMQILIVAFSLFALGTPASILVTKFVDKITPDDEQVLAEKS